MSAQTSTNKRTAFSQSSYCRWCENCMMYGSDGDWDDFACINVWLYFVYSVGCCLKKQFLLQFLSIIISVLTRHIKFLCYFIPEFWFDVPIVVLFVSLVSRKWKIPNQSVIWVLSIVLTLESRANRRKCLARLSSQNKPIVLGQTARSCWETARKSDRFLCRHCHEGKGGWFLLPCLESAQTMLVCCVVSVLARV
jgi:hypothetical protein